MIRTIRCLVVFTAWVVLAPTDAFAEYVYWTNRAEAKVQRRDVSGGLIEDLWLGSAASEPRGLALDVAAGKMYWADNGTDIIYRANLDGGDPGPFYVSPPTFLADLAIDPQGGKLYWADRDQNVIRRANLDGSGVVEDVWGSAAGVRQPYFLALDLPAGSIYWGDFNNTVIHRANLDGSGAIENVVTGLSQVRDVALDRTGGMIYWADRGSHKVQRTNLDGSGPVQDLFDATDGLNLPHGIALDVPADMVYWADTTAHRVMRGRMDGSGTPEVIFTNAAAEPWAVALTLPVPEPSAVSLAVAGLLAALVWAWRRRP